MAYRPATSVVRHPLAQNVREDFAESRTTRYTVHPAPDPLQLPIQAATNSYDLRNSPLVPAVHAKDGRLNGPAPLRVSFSVQDLQHGRQTELGISGLAQFSNDLQNLSPHRYGLVEIAAWNGEWINLKQRRVRMGYRHLHQVSKTPRKWGFC